MMLRALLVVALTVALVFAEEEEDALQDHGCCSAEDRHEIEFLWERVWASAFTDRKVHIARSVFLELFERFPEAKQLFQRVNVENMDSPEYRAHLVRVVNGLDSIISLMEDPDVLLKQVEHLTNQHIARPGVKGVYIQGMVQAFEHVMEQIAPCFNIEAFERCFGKVTNMIASKLP